MVMFAEGDLLAGNHLALLDRMMRWALRFHLLSRVFQEEASFTKAAMDKVHSSYLRSLQEVGDLLKKRTETIKNLKI